MVSTLTLLTSKGPYLAMSVQEVKISEVRAGAYLQGGSKTTYHQVRVSAFICAGVRAVRDLGCRLIPIAKAVLTASPIYM
jgi:hypothetical protein